MRLPGNALTLVSSLCVFLLAALTVFPEACSAKNTLPTFARVSSYALPGRRQDAEVVVCVCVARSSGQKSAKQDRKLLFSKKKNSILGLTGTRSA
jgi:hypothetical protein